MRKQMETGPTRGLAGGFAVTAASTLSARDIRMGCGGVVASLAKVRRAMHLDAKTLLYGQMAKLPDGRSPYSWFDGNLSLHDIVVDTSVPVMSRFVWALYPTLDAVLLALVVRAGVARRLQGSPALLVAGGVACWLLADFAFTLPAVAGGYVALLTWWLDRNVSLSPAQMDAIFNRLT